MSIVSRKKIANRIFWGVVLIGTAVLLILNGIGMDLGYGINAWRIIGAVICVACLIDRIVESKFTETVIPLAFLFLIFEPTIAHAIGKADDDLTLIPTWTVILSAVLLTIGLKVIFREKSGVKSSSKISLSSIYLDGADLSNARISDNLGSVQAYVTNVEAYDGNGKITISDNMGTVKLHLPSTWTVIADCHDNMGKISIPEQKEAVYDKSIKLYVCDNMGTVEVIFD